MTEPSYDELVAPLDEFHAAWPTRPWSLDRLQAANDRAADLVDRADRRPRRARRLTRPTGTPLPADDQAKTRHARYASRGPGARPMQTDWARHRVRQCQAAGVVAVFVKRLRSRLGRDHHDITTITSDLQIREYPDKREVPA